MKNIALLILCAFLSCGCGNGFSRFYIGQTAEEVQANPDYIAENDITVKRVQMEDPDIMVKRMFSLGYDLVGSSAWEGPANEGDAEAKAQAKKIGASCVLWGAEYDRTESGVIPVTTYTPGSTSTTYHSGTVFSGNGSGHYSGTSTTYNPGTTSVDYMPYSVNRYNYFGVFFIKSKPGILGVRVDDPGVAYKKKFETNSGGLIVAMVNSGRASKADILIGDIIMNVNGSPYIPGSANPWRKGGDNAVQIYRDGKIITKNIFLDDGNSVKSN